MSEVERRRSHWYNAILIESDRVLNPVHDDAVIYITGAQVELLRNITVYLRRRHTYVDENHPGYYLVPDDSDFDDILAIVSDLEETLMGNPNTLFGYSEQLHVDGGETKSGDGNYTASSGQVPAEKIWLVQSITFQNRTAARGAVHIWVQLGGDRQWLIQNDNPGTVLQTWTGCIVLKEDDEIECLQNSCIDGDVMRFGVLGDVMVVPA